MLMFCCLVKLAANVLVSLLIITQLTLACFCCVVLQVLAAGSGSPALCRD